MVFLFGVQVKNASLEITFGVLGGRLLLHLEAVALEILELGSALVGFGLDYVRGLLGDGL